MRASLPGVFWRQFEGLLLAFREGFTLKSAYQFASMFTHRFTSAIFLIVSQLLKSVHTFGKGTSKN